MVDQLQSCCWLGGVKRRARVGFPGTVKGPLLLLTSLEAFHRLFQPSKQTLKSSAPRAYFWPYTSHVPTRGCFVPTRADLVPTVHSTLPDPSPDHLTLPFTNFVIQKALRLVPISKTAASKMKLPMQ